MVREDRRMPLREHLNELRVMLIRCAIVLVVLLCVGLYFDSTLLRFMCEPWTKTRAALAPPAGPRDPGALTYLSPGEGMMASLRVSFLASVAFGAPYFIWELWHFIGVGLKARERAAIRMVFIPGVILFLVGLWFGFDVMLPVGLQAMVNYLPPDIAVSNVTLENYLQLVIAITLIMGGVFELPLVMWAVVRTGLISRKTIASSRRVVILGLAVFAALITPTTDAVNMLLVFVPMLGLFELGLLACFLAERARARALARQLDPPTV
jgi:sec-independent protein translocase protein TatC